MSPPQAGDDPVARVHLRVFGTDINALLEEEGGDRDREIQKLLDTQEDRGMAGKSLEDRAVAMLRTRHKVR